MYFWTEMGVIAQLNSLWIMGTGLVEWVDAVCGVIEIRGLLVSGGNTLSCNLFCHMQLPFKGLYRWQIYFIGQLTVIAENQAP